MVYKDLFETPIERIYRQVSQPCPPKPAPKVSDPPAPISLEPADVQDILKNKRSASVEELSWILENAKQFCLNIRQRNDLSLRTTIALAGRGRPASHPNAELYSQLDIAETPVGLLHHRSWFENELRAGAKAIANCKLHRPPRCDCTKEARQRLWFVQDRYGIKSPEAWAATWLYEEFEQLEQASRPQRAQVLGTQSAAILEEKE